jgi:hypothetical protein
MKIAISQPTYLPWLGYFDLIHSVDIFVFLDSVQFEKQSWQQRNRIKTPDGLQWLTVPVIFRGRLSQQIKDVQIREPEFWRKHLRTIELNYRRSPYFDMYFSDLSSILKSFDAGSPLLELNIALIVWMMKMFGLRTQLVRSSTLEQGGKKSGLLLNICRLLNARTYFSPLGSANYLLPDMQAFHDYGIDVLFQQYIHPEYSQMFSPFVPYASALDLLFNEGARALEILLSGRRRPYLPDELKGQMLERA